MESLPAVLLWFALTLPAGALIVTWGWAVLRRERGLGRLLIGWGVALPLLPPLLTVGTWLLVGDAHPAATERTADEPWPYWFAVGVLSFGAAVVLTPLLAIVAAFWMLAAPSPDARESGLNNDPRR